MNKCKYEWKLGAKWPLTSTSEEKCKPKVFSTFSCGGGSTMGYKLAGFDVIGGNDIDKKMSSLYINNHKPKHFYNTDIRELINGDLDDELYNLDVLDGSPPCSTFSMAGLREKAWGKSKKFKEGQSVQVLDVLIYEFLKLAHKLQSKIILIENVKGLMMGNAKSYMLEIYQRALHAGYFLNHYVIDSSRFGLPQKRERLFFIGVRKDLAIGLTPPLRRQPEFRSLHTSNPKDIQLSEVQNILTPLVFRTERKVPFSRISCRPEQPLLKIKNDKLLKLWAECEAGKSFSTVHPKGSYFNTRKVDLNKPLPTITATGGNLFHPSWPRVLTKRELMLASSWPLDYDFGKVQPWYVMGMSVPPLVMAYVAQAIKEQYLKKVNFNLKIQ